MARKPDHVSQEAWDAVNSPELTNEALGKLRPARDALPPALFDKLTRHRGPQKAPTKEAVSLRLDRDVLDYFRAQGQGWQTKINEALRQVATAEKVSLADHAEGEGWPVRTTRKVGRTARSGGTASKDSNANPAKSRAK
jgi:uncharacterized protein (DUF4415 family)